MLCVQLEMNWAMVATVLCSGRDALGNGGSCVLCVQLGTGECTIYACGRRRSQLEMSIDERNTRTDVAMRDGSFLSKAIRRKCSAMRALLCPRMNVNSGIFRAKINQRWRLEVS